ncbi:MAG: hypothetical protein M3442_06445 [Chloroflexota bacterium]|nr:hypothetical protein [Chloroflexota bacterium]
MTPRPPATPATPTAAIIRAVTSLPGHHSAGYYDKTPWDVSGRYLLALRASFCDRPPAADDVATLGLVDLWNDDAFLPFAETRAWNWQQGCMLYWLRAPLPHSEPPVPPDERHLVIYNDRDGDRFVSVVVDALTGREVRRLPLPVYGLSPDGRQAVTLNFSRLHRERPGYGYAGVPDAWAEVLEPYDDGIFWMDTETGDHRLVVPTARMAQTARQPLMKGAVHRFNHLQWSPDCRRFAFLHRWRPPAEAPRGHLTRLCAVAPDGSGLAILADEALVSHYDWRDPSHILAWARHMGREAFFLYADDHDHHDRSGAAQLVAPEAMPRDGHCSYSPDAERRFVANDTYPDAERKRTLYVYDTRTGDRTDLGRFFAPPELANDCRVDLHPRWSRDGHMLCFDSAHEGSRQLYVADVSGLTAA